MTWMVACVAALVVLGAVLAMAEASISRMTRVRAAALKEGDRRNAALLETIELDPAPYLNSIYLAVMLAQNGSAILVARLAGWYFDDLGITLASVGFTLAYFIVVEAMAKTFAILHSDRVALALAPVVWALGRMLALPTRALIGIANVLLPGKGLKQGPFVSQQDIRSMAEVGHEEGVIEETEKEMIHSIFAFGDTLVREVMVPRPDIVAVQADQTIDDAMDVVLKNKFSRLPVHRGDPDHCVGVLHEKDILAALYAGHRQTPVTELVRPAHFVPETSHAAALLRRMQREQFHMAIVVDEHGSTSGLVTLENLLEELVGNIADEHDFDEEKDIERLADGTYRFDASVSIRELNDLLGTDFPRERWNTVGGLMFGVLGTIPTQGESVALEGWRFTAEKVQGRRVTTVLVHPTALLPKRRSNGMGREPLPAAVLRALGERLGDRVSVRPADLAAASRDASSLPGSLPDAVVWPLTTDEVQAVVRLAAPARIPVTARGAGSSLEGNPIPVRGGVVCDLSRMTEVLAVRADDLQVDVQPGVVYAALNRALRPHALFFPPAPGGSADVATIGGMVANNASGIYSVRYGGTRDHVRAATVVTGAGDVLRLGNRCRKSASGYHLLGLLVGSEGTLAIATELTLALAGLPAACRQGAFRFAGAPAAARATADVIRFGLDVAAIEFLDARTMTALERFGRYGLAAAPTLLVEVHGSAASIDEGWRSATEVVRDAGGEPVVLPDGRDAWSIREQATRAIAAGRPDAAVVRADVAIPIGALPALVERCEALAAERGLAVHLFGHAGIGILHALVLADASERPAAEAARDALVEHALTLGGSCSGEHGMGLGNRGYAAREHGAALALMQGVKALFDPHGILNPGKMW